MNMHLKGNVSNTHTKSLAFNKKQIELEVIESQNNFAIFPGRRKTGWFYEYLFGYSDVFKWI